MKMLAIAIIIILPIISVQDRQVIKLELDALVNPEFISKKDSKELYMTHPGQLRPFIRKDIDDVQYIIAYEESTRKIKYITTSDEDFVTDNGLQIGKWINLTKDEILVYPGWEIRGPITKGGWYPVVGFMGKIIVNIEGNEIETDINHILKSLSSIRFQVKIVGFSKGGN